MEIHDSVRTERASFLVNDGDVAGLRSAVWKLNRIGYSENLVRDRLGLEDLAQVEWRHLPAYRRDSLAARDALDLAIDLFLLQGTLSVDELGQLFTRTEREGLIRAGILAVDVVGAARARASIFPINDCLVFSDHAWPELPHPGYASVPSDHVMAVGLDSRTLARCTVRRRFDSALDLCTGSGIQAILAAHHANHVVAVDINPRAVECARFNAQASSLANLEVVAGDLFEPVRDQRFDLITANPPFVPSPLDHLKFRDGGRSGEEIQKRIVAGLPDHLAPSGIAQMVTELGERDSEPLSCRLREWLNGAAMDIHILRVNEHSPIKYAIGHAQGDDYETFLASTDQWLSNLRAQGYVRVVSLMVSFQWSDPAFGGPWDRVEQCRPPQQAAGGEIESAFVAERLSRILGWSEIVNQSWIRRAEPIAMLDARVLGRNLRAKATATPLGRALKIERLVDPLDREILEQMEGRVSGAELIKAFRDRNADEGDLMAAVRSLVRQQLLRLEGWEKPEPMLLV